MSADKDRQRSHLIESLRNQARRFIEQGDCERAAEILQGCLHLEPGPDMRGSILDNLGYACLNLGWFENAAKVYSEYLKINPSDNDGRFFLASAYASMKWTNEAIAELKIILTSDPTDVLARHDLSLCYRDMGWIRESLEEMRRANKYAVIYGSPEEKEIVKASLGNLEKEIEDGDDDHSKIISLLVLLIVVRKMSRMRRKRPKH